MTTSIATPPLSVRLQLLPLLLAWAMAPSMAHASPPPELCRLLRAFVASTGDDEERAFTFHTAWGHGFTDADDSVVSARSCEHGGHEHARRVCDYLMEHGSAEFPGLNAMHAISCLSTKTRFAPGTRFHQGHVTFDHGTARRGALIDVSLQADADKGSRAFRLSARGYGAARRTARAEGIAPDRPR